MKPLTIIAILATVGLVSLMAGLYFHIDWLAYIGLMISCITLILIGSVDF